MTTTRAPEAQPLAGHSPAHEERPLGGYATLMSLFGLAVGGFATWMRRSGRELPERIPRGDLALITLDTHKTARLVAKDRVSSAVRAPFSRVEGDADAGESREKARGHGLRRAVGELLTCPYCIGLWIAAAFAAGFAVAPRPTRWVASLLTAVFGSDVLQIAYRKAEDSLWPAASVRARSDSWRTPSRSISSAASTSSSRPRSASSDTSP